MWVWESVCLKDSQNFIFPRYYIQYKVLIKIRVNNISVDYYQYIKCTRVNKCVAVSYSCILEIESPWNRKIVRTASEYQTTLKILLWKRKKTRTLNLAWVCLILLGLVPPNYLSKRFYLMSTNDLSTQGRTRNPSF